MKEIRRRRAEEILEEICGKARSYTPEWHPDPKNPDIGEALAEVYAGIISGLDRKYALLPGKYCIDFFNCLNVSMKTASPAEGFAVFGLSGEDAGGCLLEEGTLLRSDVQDEAGEGVPAELKEDVFVVPDTLEVIYETDGKKDYIGLLYRSDMEEKNSFPLFGRSAENLERHVFYLGHPWMFRIRRSGSIGIRFLDSRGNILPEEILSRFTDSNAVRFFYDTGEETGQEELSAAVLKDGTLWITRKEDQDPWSETEMAGISEYWLGCEVRDIRGLESFAPARIVLTADFAPALPDAIYAAGSDQPLEEPCFPFGERFSLYDEIYFGSEDILSKKGAWAELSFQEEFIRVPITEDEKEDVEWKLVMTKEQFKQEKQYDITIEEVLWEYYNGSGWARLFKGSEYTDTFREARGSGRQLKKLKFTCPEDLAPVLAGSGTNYYIRARVMKVNNAYKTAGQYVTPVISDVRLSCGYPGEGEEPDRILAENHLENDIIRVGRERKAGRLLMPVKASEDNRPAMYFGLRTPLLGGPVRLLWETEQIMDEVQPAVSWEYYRAGGWAPLSPADETENFRLTGILTFAGIPDAVSRKLFGEELYWIRAVRTETPGEHRPAPRILSWYLNASRIVTLRHGLREYLTMENAEPGFEFRLQNRNIHRLELWVKEEERLGQEEEEELRKEGSLLEVLDENGGREYSWVRWKQTDTLTRHGPADRVYTLDENEGIITFGGGASGKMPSPGVLDGIRAEYSVGGGKICSLPARAVNGLELSEGFVNSVSNPMPLFGAYDRETVSGAIRRAASENKHHFRAVTEDDFEDLAKNAAGNVRKARCFSGLSPAGKPMPGAVTLVLLADEEAGGGIGFETLKKKLYRWFEDKIPGTLSCGESFCIRRAEMVEIELHMEARIADYQRLYRIQKGLEEKLAEFLDPEKGSFDGRGWDIGTLPERFQLETLIRSADGIEGLERCVIFSRVLTRPGCPAVSYEEIRRNPFVLPVNGKHVIRLELKK